MCRQHPGCVRRQEANPGLAHRQGAHLRRQQCELLARDHRATQIVTRWPESDRTHRLTSRHGVTSPLESAGERLPLRGIRPAGDLRPEPDPCHGQGSVSTRRTRSEQMMPRLQPLEFHSPASAGVQKRRGDRSIHLIDRHELAGWGAACDGDLRRHNQLPICGLGDAQLNLF
jgi:hypothetical protein